MIIFSHLLNDRSGSPKVLSAVIASLSNQGVSCRLFIGSEGDGYLDEAGVPTTRYWYRRTGHRILTLFTFLASQIHLFFKLLFSRGIDADALVYVNTLLPFGAAIYGKMTGRRVLYHLHEVSLKPAILSWFLKSIAKICGCRLIYVSDFHRHTFHVSGAPAETIYSALDPEFLAKANASNYAHKRNGQFNVLMLASLRDYKGVPEFLALAESLLVARPEIRFELVANDDSAAIGRYFLNRLIPSNLVVHARTADPSAFYARASLVLNLSRPDQWVETFGLTLLEAMAFGVPVIAPPVGGPLELVTDCEEGFLVDCRDEKKVQQLVRLLADEDLLCSRMSNAGRARASKFSFNEFSEVLLRTVSK